jgi:hypothetical protein
MLAILKGDAFVWGDPEPCSCEQVDSRIRFAAMDFVSARCGVKVVPHAIAPEAIFDLCGRRGGGDSTWHSEVAQCSKKRVDARLQWKDDVAGWSVKLAPCE